MIEVTIVLNGYCVSDRVEDRCNLADFIREHEGLTGTHLGCEHGVCGACTVLLDDNPVRSCITLAAASDGLHVQTIEGFGQDEVMEILRLAFREEHGLQCGFCTPGMLITARDLLLRGATRNAQEVRAGLAGNICRCTGYDGIVRAILLAAGRLRTAEITHKPT